MRSQEKYKQIEEIVEELKEEYHKCDELFNIAYELNSNENTKTAFSQKVMSYMPEVMQTLGFLIGNFEREQTEISHIIRKSEEMIEEDYKKTFARNLKYFMNVNSKTQSDLVNYMKISSSTASDWCNGKKMPRMDKIQSLCNYLGIKKIDLLFYDADKI